MRDAVTLTRPARIVAALQRLDGDAGVIERHAQLIHYAMLDHVAAQRARGHDIGRGDDRAYARPRSATAGPARELRDLRRACRNAITGKISREDWTTAWAAQPERIKALWKPLLIETGKGRSIDRSTLAAGFEVEGFAMLAPRPEIVLPAIERNLAQITATPQPKTRTRNVEETAAIAAIRAAYRAITGHSAGADDADTRACTHKSGAAV